MSRTITAFLHFSECFPQHIDNMENYAIVTVEDGKMAAEKVVHESMKYVRIVEEGYDVLRV